MSTNKRPTIYTKAQNTFFPESEKVKLNILSKLNSKSTSQDVVQSLMQYALALAKDEYNYNPRDKRILSINNALTTQIKDEVVKALEKTSTTVVENIQALSETDIRNIIQQQLKDQKVSVQPEDINEILKSVTDSVCSTSSVIKQLFEEKAQKLQETIAEDVKNATTDEDKAKIIANGFEKALQNNSTTTQISQVFDKNKTLQNIQEQISKFNSKQLSFQTSFSKSFLRVNKNVADAIDDLRDVNGKIGKWGKTKIVGQILTGKLKLDPTKRLMKAIPIRYRVMIRLIQGISKVTSAIYKGIINIITFPFKKIFNEIKNTLKDVVTNTTKIIGGLFFNFIRTPAGMFALGWVIGFIVGKIKSVLQPVIDFVKNWGMPLGIAALASAIAAKLREPGKYKALRETKEQREKEFKERLDEETKARKAKEEAEKRANEAKERAEKTQRDLDEAKRNAEIAKRKAELESENKRLNDEAIRTEHEVERLESQLDEAIKERDAAFDARDDANAKAEHAEKMAQEAETKFKNATNRLNKFEATHEKLVEKYKANIEAEKIRADHAEKVADTVKKDADIKLKQSEDTLAEAKAKVNDITKSIDSIKPQLDVINKKLDNMHQRISQNNKSKKASAKQSTKDLLNNIFKLEARKAQLENELVKLQKQSVEAQGKAADAQADEAKTAKEVAKTVKSDTVSRGSIRPPTKSYSSRYNRAVNVATLATIFADIAAGEGARYAENNGNYNAADILNTVQNAAGTIGTGALTYYGVNDVLNGTSGGFNPYSAALGGAFAAYQIWNDGFRDKYGYYDPKTGGYKTYDSKWDAYSDDPYARYLMLAGGLNTFTGSIAGPAGMLISYFPGQTIAMANKLYFTEKETDFEKVMSDSSIANLEAYAKYVGSQSKRLAIGQQPTVLGNLREVDKLLQQYEQFNKNYDLSKELGFIDFNDAGRELTKQQYDTARNIIITQFIQKNKRKPKKYEVDEIMKKLGFKIETKSYKIRDGLTRKKTTYHGKNVVVSQTMDVGWFDWLTNRLTQENSQTDASSQALEKFKTYVGTHGINETTISQLADAVQPGLSATSEFKNASFQNKVKMFLDKYKQILQEQENALTPEQKQLEQQLDKQFNAPQPKTKKQINPDVTQTEDQKKENQQGKNDQNDLNPTAMIAQCTTTIIQKLNSIEDLITVRREA